MPDILKHSVNTGFWAKTLSSRPFFTGPESCLPGQTVTQGSHSLHYTLCYRRIISDSKESSCSIKFFF